MLQERKVHACPDRIDLFRDSFSPPSIFGGDAE
jgi:hypothetical protein